MELDKYIKRRLVCALYTECEDCPFHIANPGECLNPVEWDNTEEAFEAAKRLKEKRGLIWVLYKVNDDPQWYYDIFDSNSVALIGQHLVTLKQLYSELKVAIL